tara:strand:- start:8890 stop:9777 length:888 start_codon:yes stop_codon:yes gene_type:complete
MPDDYQILLYYRYQPISDPESFVEEHRAFCEELELRGRILIGHEGINGTVSGKTATTERYMEALIADERTKGIEFKVDPAPDHAFKKLSVKFRSEIVTLGLDEEDVDPNEVTGKRLSPKEWLETMETEDPIIIDGRNDYESALGHFKGAICPDVGNFRDFPKWIQENLADAKDRKVLTYCTGGIRCEKLSGYLVKEGFQDVSQLDGGIVKYGKDPETQGKNFDGLCYVFDERIAVESNFTETRKVISRCEKCGEECARYRNCAWPDCNRQHFLCESCEETKGRYCSENCEAGAQV